jgi:hydrogenase maturation protease
VTVIGLGNSDMGDDGVGVALVQMLRGERERGLWGADPGSRAAAARLVVADRDPLLAGACIAEGDAALLVDAMDMNGEPGAWRVFGADEAEFSAPVRGGSAHGMSAAEIVEIARALGCARGLRLMGIQLADRRPGMGLSPAVSRVLPECLERIKQEVELLP